MRTALCPQQLAIVIADIAKLNTNQLRRLHDSIGTLPDPVSAMQVVTQSPLPVLTQSHSWSTVPTRTLPWSLVLTQPLDHDLVPRHRRCTPDEITALGMQLPATRAGHARLSHLPCLQSNDPIAQYLALNPGEVVHIERLDGSVYYRIVVKAL